MHTPPQCDLQQREIVILGHRLDQHQTLEDLGLEVAVAVHGAHGGGGVAVAALRGERGVGDVVVFSRKDAAGERVVDYDREGEFAAAGNQLGFDGAGCVLQCIMC